jgi:hypothetical protein
LTADINISEAASLGGLVIFDAFNCMMAAKTRGRGAGSVLGLASIGSTPELRGRCSSSRRKYKA